MNGNGMLEGAVLQYLDEQSEVDAHFKSVYRKDRSDFLIKYITEQARKALNGKDGGIRSDVVFKWARDYYNDGICQQDIEKEEKEKKEREERKANFKPMFIQSQPKEEVKEKEKDMQLSMF